MFHERKKKKRKKKKINCRRELVHSVCWLKVRPKHIKGSKEGYLLEQNTTCECSEEPSTRYENNLAQSKNRCLICVFFFFSFFLNRSTVV